LSLARLTGDLNRLLTILQGADASPTPQAVAAAAAVQKDLTRLLARWGRLKAKEVKALNEQLRQANLPLLTPDGKEENQGK
jgi:hypothetical protein